ncbi:hypothetical protein, partial [Paracidovorax citrulli]|uniref:hypothetical protein n=1 Tax=Paracidovorax citrulli TaxID=80869 RepID=UPI0036700E7C
WLFVFRLPTTRQPQPPQFLATLQISEPLNSTPVFSTSATLGKTFLFYRLRHLPSSQPSQEPQQSQ